MASEKAIDRYLQALLSPDRNVKRKAVKGLVESGSLKALPVLEKLAAESADPELSFLAKKGLAVIKASAEFSQLLSASDTESRGKPTADLEALKQHLANPDPTMRARVIKAAVATKDPHILDVLIPMLNTEESSLVKGLILLAVGILGDNSHLAVLSGGIKSTDPALRKAAVDALGSMNKPYAFPFLVEALNDRDKPVRAAAFALLKRLGKVNLLKLLETMLSSKAPWMKESALRACGRFNSEEVVTMLSSYLEGADKKLATIAARSLKGLSLAGNRKARELLKTFERKPREAQQAGEAAPISPPSLELPPPVELSPAAVDLASPDARKRLKFLQDTLLHGTVSVLPDIIKRLPVEPDAKVRASMLVTLGRLGGKDELDIIVPYLEDEEDRLRASAVEAVARIEDADLARLLSPRLQDKDNRTRANAIVALRGIDGIDLNTPLKELAASKRIRDRLSAIYAITHIENEEGFKILDRLCKDPSRVVAKRADEALQILAGKRKNSPSRPDETTPTAPFDNRPRRKRQKRGKHGLKPGNDSDGKTGDKKKNEGKGRSDTESSPDPADDGTAAEGATEDKHETIQKPGLTDESKAVKTKKPESSRRGKGRKQAKQLKSSKAPSGSGKDNAEKRGGIPKGILIHGGFDVAVATLVAAFGLFLVSTEGPPIDEVLIPFFIVFLLFPAVFLVAGLGLLTGQSWGRHINGCFLFILVSILRVPFIAPRLLAMLVSKESLDFLNMKEESFPAALYCAVAVGTIVFFIAVVMWF